jgi:hypothetical protein
MKTMISIAALALVLSTAHAKEPNGFRAGAAKVDITPAKSGMMPGDTIRDSLNVRALVIGNGTTCAVLVGVDQGGIRDEAARDAITRSAQASGCPTANIVVSATHTHSGSNRNIMDPKGDPSPQRVADAIVTAVSEASKAMRPAKIGYGTGQLDININRDLFAGGQWLQGPNAEGPSDKTLAVLQVVGEDDLPIAVYMNYAMHPIHFYLSGVVSADVPGDAARYVENRFGGDTVAIFAQGAAGDQNPNRLQAMYDLIENRAGIANANDKKVSRPGFWIESAREHNINTTLTAGMAKPVPKERLAAYRAAIAREDALVAAKGALMGETVLDIMRFGTPTFQTDGTIAGGSEMIQCPGRDRTDRDDPVREGALPPYADGAPVSIKEGMLRIGDVYVASINGEVYNEIATRLKNEAPASKLMMTTLANGMANSGYIYSNAASPHLTFQVISSRLKPGCAEDKIVNAGTRLIGQLQR